MHNKNNQILKVYPLINVKMPINLTKWPSVKDLVQSKGRNILLAKLPLSLTRNQAMKIHRTAPSVRNFGMRREGLLASRSSRFSSEERSCGTHSIEGWMGYTNGMDALEETEIPCPCWDLKNNYSVAQPVALSVYWLCYPDSTFYLYMRYLLKETTENTGTSVGPVFFRELNISYWL